MTATATESIGASTPARGRWDGPLLWSWLGLLALVRAGTLQEADPYWQVRAGLENLDGQPLVRPDAWSWAPVDGSFVQTSPLWNDLLGLAWRGVGGFPGLFLVTLLSLLLYLGVTVSLARRLGARPLPGLGGLLVVLLLALPMLSPRGTLVAQTLFLAGILLADGWRRRASRPPLLVDAGLVAVGAFLLAWVGSWLHLSWMLLAPATAAAWGVLWWSAASTAPRRWPLAVSGVVGAAAGVLAGPYGTSAWSISRSVQEACAGVVTEWLGMFTSGLAARWVPAGLVGLAGFGLALVWVVRRWRSRLEDSRIGVIGALCVLGVPAALGAISAIRFIGIALLALAPVAALAATTLADRAAARASAEPPTGAFRSARVRFWSQGKPWRVVITLVAVIVTPVALLAAATLARPAAVMPALDALPQGCRLFTAPATAAPVILLRPDVKVWMDTRADYYGRERNQEAVDVLTGNDLEVPAITGADCALLDPGAGIDTSSLAAAFDASPEWRSVTPAGSSVPVWVRTQ